MTGIGPENWHSTAIERAQVSGSTIREDNNGKVSRLTIMVGGGVAYE